MAITVKPDLLRNSGINKQYNRAGQPTFLQIDRCFMVSGIPQSVGTADQITSIAEAAVKSQVPIGTPHSVETLALARYYRVDQDGRSHDTLPVTVSYIYDANGGSDTTWTIESDTFLEQQQTDSQYDGAGNLTPVMVDNYYKSWVFDGARKVGEAPLTAYGTVPVFKPRKRLVMTKTIFGATAANTLEAAAINYIGMVNGSSFRSGDLYTWLCMDCSVIFEPYKGQFLGRLEFIYRPETWKEWLRFSNRELGTPPNIWKKDNNTGQPNGMKQITPYQTADFTALVNLI
jgi:hypothetical protein